jgi:hypothetical protein
VDPAFVVRRVSPVATDLASGQIPILNVNVPLVLTLRTAVDNASVAFAEVVQLNAGDVIGLFYDADGFTSALTITGEWSMARVGDLPE